jgi:hypothetical protein
MMSAGGLASIAPSPKTLKTLGHAGFLEALRVAPHR